MRGSTVLVTPTVCMYVRMGSLHPRTIELGICRVGLAWA